MLSRASEYALRAMVSLAANYGQTMTSGAIAKDVKISSEYLIKVMGTLVRSGLVKSRRGRSGGFSLEADPASTTLLQVLNAVDPLRRFDTCPIESSDHCLELCTLHRLMNAAVDDVHRRFGGTTLQQIVDDMNEKPVRMAGADAPKRKRRATDGAKRPTKTRP